QPLRQIHLHSTHLIGGFPGGGNVQYVYILSIIAIVILAVACINFMNLATARSARRAKEVGLRKVAGAVRAQLIRQFLAESSLIAFLALILAILLVAIFITPFNNLSGKNLSLDLLDGQLLTGLLVITLATGLISGSYPALFLSGFLPAKVLKGNLKAGAGNSIFRNTLVVMQFAASIALLIGTAVVYNQLTFMQNRNRGFNKENLVYAHMNGVLWDKYATLRTELEGNSLTSDFTVVSDLPTEVANATIGVEWEGKDPASQPLFVNLAIDENFFDVFGVTLLSGRAYSK